MVGPLQEKLAKMEPELKEIVTESKGGKRVRVAYFKDGTYQEVPFEPDLSKLQFTDTGDRAGVGIDPFTGQQRSSGFAKGMDPGQRDASNRGWQGLNLQRDQFERGRTVYDTERGASVNLDTNTATPVKMAGQPLPAKVPESAKKEVMSIDQQLAAVKGAMDAVKSTPSAFSFGRGAATMAGPMSESVRGRFDNTKEQQARSYVFNVVSKVINERAGAAQSAQELARLRSFLPAETDSPGQVESKLQGFEKYLGDLRGAVTGVAGPTGQTSSPSASGRSPTGGRHSVTAPGGKVYYFTSAAAADGFRKMSGGQ